MNRNTFSTSGIKIIVDKALYSKEAIFKTLYWYSDRFITLVDQLPPNHLQIQLEPITPMDIEEIEKAFKQFNQDLIDFQLRQIIHEETKNLRDLITAKAFADGDLDEMPSGDITDPVGFKIK